MLQYEQDFPGEPLQGVEARIFPFPSELNEENVKGVLENIRFFGVSDINVFDSLFSYLIDNRTMIGLNDDFPEIRDLWLNINYVVENEPKREKICEKAAGNNLIYLLRYTHHNGCPWDDSTTINAALGGHIECLLMRMDVLGMKGFARMPQNIITLNF